MNQLKLAAAGAAGGGWQHTGNEEGSCCRFRRLKPSFSVLSPKIPLSLGARRY